MTRSTKVLKRPRENSVGLYPEGEASACVKPGATSPVSCPGLPQLHEPVRSHTRQSLVLIAPRSLHFFFFFKLRLWLTSTLSPTPARSGVRRSGKSRINTHQPNPLNGHQFPLPHNEFELQPLSAFRVPIIGQTPPSHLSSLGNVALAGRRCRSPTY